MELCLLTPHQLLPACRREAEINVIRTSLGSLRHSTREKDQEGTELGKMKSLRMTQTV